MTLCLAVITPRSAWLISDRRLSLTQNNGAFYKVHTDEATKQVGYVSDDGSVGAISYCGIGAYQKYYPNNHMMELSEWVRKNMIGGQFATAMDQTVSVCKHAYYEKANFDSKDQHFLGIVHKDGKPVICHYASNKAMVNYCDSGPAFAVIMVGSGHRYALKWWKGEPNISKDARKIHSAIQAFEHGRVNGSEVAEMFNPLIQHVHDRDSFVGSNFNATWFDIRTKSAGACAIHDGKMVPSMPSFIIKGVDVNDIGSAIIKNNLSGTYDVTATINGLPVYKPFFSHWR